MNLLHLDVYVGITLCLVAVIMALYCWQLYRAHKHIYARRSGFGAVLLLAIAVPMVLDRHPLEESNPRELADLDVPWVPAHEHLDIQADIWNFEEDAAAIGNEDSSIPGLMKFNLTPEVHDGDAEAGMEADGRPQAWSLLLRETFTAIEQARNLRDDLQNQGYAAYLLVQDRDGDAILRVAIGPFLVREHALQSRNELLSALDIGTDLHRFGI